MDVLLSMRSLHARITARYSRDAAGVEPVIYFVVRFEVIERDVTVEVTYRYLGWKKDRC